MPDLSANLEPFLLVARSTKGAAAAKVVVDATSAPGVYGFGELLEMPNIRQLKEHETLSSHYDLLQLFAYGTYQSYQANQASYPALNPSQVEKLKQLSLVSLGMESRSLTYPSLLPILDQPSIRALEDLIIDAIYAGIISGRMDQVNERFSVDWVLGRDLSVGGSELRDLGKRLDNWCEMTENLLSSLDTTIARSRAQTVASNAFAHKQQQERFNAYDTFSAALSAKNANSSKKQPQQSQVNRRGLEGSAQMPGSFGAPGEAAPEGSAPTSPSRARNTQTQGQQPTAGSEVLQEGGSSGPTVAEEGQNGSGPSRVRTLSGTSASQETDAVRRKRGKK
ncbi:hypothetical protein NCC49_000067 [Naganishia albida]|nr:hypothetical protein NCC49_000067 [Naganishia albida]